MGIYRKKPVVIEAFIVGEAKPQWFMDAYRNGKIRQNGSGGGFIISTLEGEMHAAIGDYIIKGVAGEIYPCKPDIFAATYTEESEATNEN